MSEWSIYFIFHTCKCIYATFMPYLSLLMLAEILLALGKENKMCFQNFMLTKKEAMKTD